MTVLVEAKNMEVTQALRRHVFQQAQRLTRLGKKIVGISVFLETIPKKSNDPHANKVTFKVRVPGKDVVVMKQAVDMYQAIVEAAHGAFRQVRKLAERRITTARRTAEKTFLI